LILADSAAPQGPSHLGTAGAWRSEGDPVAAYVAGKRCRDDQLHSLEWATLSQIDTGANNERWWMAEDFLMELTSHC